MGVSRATTDEHYRRGLEYLQCGDWPAAEGLLLHVRRVCGRLDPVVADALAYALLMQGEYRACAEVLEPVLTHPQRSFWIAHKAGDAHRGLHQQDAAVRFYRQALADGSTSLLTSRNLLQTLYGMEPQLALAELFSWRQPLQAAWLEGAQAAAELVPGMELAQWLWDHELANASLQRRLLEQKLYRLERIDLRDLSLLGRTNDGLDQGWCAAVIWRLQQLLFTQVQSVPPANHAPTRADLV